MSASEVDLSVLVVTHNGRELALQTLLSAHESLGDVTAEWIVVDCGSRDGVAASIEARFPDVRVIRRPNLGFAAGSNVGLREARGRYTLLLNPDVTVSHGTFADLVAAMDARPGVGLASVVQTGPDGALQLTIRRDPSPRRKLGEALGLWRLPGLGGWCERVGERAQYARERDADWLCGAFLIARREALEDVGSLDERFFLFSEEVDWCLRFRRAGWRVTHLPLMRVVHHVGSAGDPRMAAQMNHSRIVFAHKHFGRAARAGFFLALLAQHVVRLALLGPWAIRSTRARRRLRGETWALRVVLGLSPAPLGPPRGGGGDRKTVYLAASAGGHVDLLDHLRPALEGRAAVWVTSPGRHAWAREAAGERVLTLPLFQSARFGRLRNVLRSAVLVLRHRPRLVVSSGAGSVVAFCALARLSGARVIFVETMARVTDASASGRVLSRLRSVVLAQWDEMRSVYPRAVICRPALWERADAPARGERAGTTVAVGSHTSGFDRLLELTDEAVAAGLLPRPVRAQIGVSDYRPRTYAASRWLTPGQLEEAMAASRHVVCHGGSGVVSMALRTGHSPLVLARRERFGEHVDDHQCQLVGKLATLGLIVPLGDEITAANVAAAEAIDPPRLTDVVKAPPMVDALREALRRCSRHEVEPRTDVEAAVGAAEGGRV